MIIALASPRIASTLEEGLDKIKRLLSEADVVGGGQWALLREGDDASQPGEHNLLCQCQLHIAVPRIGDQFDYSIRAVPGVLALWRGRSIGPSNQRGGSNGIAGPAICSRALSRIQDRMSTRHPMQPLCGCFTVRLIPAR